LCEKMPGESAETLSCSITSWQRRPCNATQITTHDSNQQPTNRQQLTAPIIMPRPTKAQVQRKNARAKISWDKVGRPKKQASDESGSEYHRDSEDHSDSEDRSDSKSSESGIECKEEGEMGPCGGKSRWTRLRMKKQKQNMDASSKQLPIGAPGPQPSMQFPAPPAMEILMPQASMPSPRPQSSMQFPALPPSIQMPRPQPAMQFPAPPSIQMPSPQASMPPPRPQPSIVQTEPHVELPVFGPHTFEKAVENAKAYLDKWPLIPEPEKRVLLQDGVNRMEKTLRSKRLAPIGWQDKNWHRQVQPPRRDCGACWTYCAVLSKVPL
jgi:hypothetical protein